MTSQKSFLAGVMLMPERGTPEEDFARALFAVLERNADLGITTDSESGLTVLIGQDEYQLDAAVGALCDLCAFEIETGAPHAVLRETLGRAVAVRHVHKQVRPPEFAVVSFVFEPGPPESGFVFVDATAPDTLPAEFAAAARRGIAAQRATGPFAGFPLTDFKARLIDGKYHEIDSTPRIFDIAARAALRDPAVRGAAVPMQPQMRLKIVAPEDFLGGVIGDLNSRGVSYSVSGAFNGRIRIEGTAPFANLFFYRRTLDAMSQNRAKCRVAFDRYVPVMERGPDPPRFPPAAAMRVA